MATHCRKVPFIRLVLTGLLCLLPCMSFAEGNYDRFLQVKQWHGKVTLRITESLTTSRSWSGGNESRSLDSERMYDFKVRTGDGMSVPVDPFVAENPEQAEAPAEKGDLMYGRDMSQMQQAMKNSGINPAMMGQIMAQMKQVQGMHVSANKYKQWTEASFDTNVKGRLSSRDTTKGKGVDTSGKLCSYVNTKSVKGNYEGTGGLSLVVNTQKQAYSFKWHSTDKSAQQAFQHYQSRDSCDGTEERSRHVPYPRLHKNEGLIVEFEPLPESLSLSGIKRVRNELDDGRTQQIELSWLLVPYGEEVPSAEVAYDTKGDEWIPEDDNEVSVKLTWDENTRPTKVRFKLYDISEEPGISLNSKDRNTDPDLEFSAANEANGYVLSRSGKTQIAIKEEVSGFSETIILHARDFGAYGKLQAEVEVGGAWLNAVAKPFDNHYLPIPYDENENYIADKWEKDVKVFGKNLEPDWDEDPEPANQRIDGDGFTLYEEYRGFHELGHVFEKGKNEKVRNGHVRMDPMYKDVFIYDRDGLFARDYKPNPAKLNWHYVDPSLLKNKGSLHLDPDKRWVNFNTSRKHFNRKQYAIYLLNEGSYDGPEPEAKDSGGKAHKFLDKKKAPRMKDGRTLYFPLRDTYKVSVYPEGITRLITRNYKNLGLEAYTAAVVKDMISCTVIHEVGHALGMVHHTDLETGAFSDKGSTSGVLSCATRYETVEELKNPAKTIFYRAAYCKKVHNCYGKINIKGL